MFNEPFFPLGRRRKFVFCILRARTESQIYIVILESFLLPENSMNRILDGLWQRGWSKRERDIGAYYDEKSVNTVFSKNIREMSEKFWRDFRKIWEKTLENFGKI